MDIVSALATTSFWEALLETKSVELQIPIAVVPLVLCLTIWYSCCGKYRKKSQGSTSGNRVYSERERTTHLSQIEQKSLFFKLREELLKENRDLKTKLLLREKQLGELKANSQQADDIIDELNVSTTQQDQHVYKLKSELREQDYVIELKGQCLKQTQAELQEKEQLLEETHQLLMLERNKLEQTCIELEERGLELEGMRKSLEKQQKMHGVLRESLRQCQMEIKKDEDMIANLRSELAECKKELEQAKNDHEAKMREKQKEKQNLVASHQREMSVQKQVHTMEMKQMSEKMNAQQRKNESLNKELMGHENIKRALELLKKEKDDLVVQHNKLLEKFDALVKELEVCTEKLKAQSESRKDGPSQWRR